jgi:transcriptional regulator with XRE-family HTH domain
MDLVLKLRELRRLSGLTQKEAAKQSGIGEKTISSFETGERIDAITVRQIQKLLRVYGVTECDFFGSAIERAVAPWERAELPDAVALTRDIEELPAAIRRPTIEKIRLVIDLARDIGAAAHPSFGASNGQRPHALRSERVSRCSTG